MRNLRTALHIGAAPIMLAGLLAGCGSDEAVVNPSAALNVITYTGTSGGTDEWTMGLAPSATVIGDGTFTVTDRRTDPATTYTGTYTVAPSGFSRLVCTDSSACTGYAFQITSDVMAFWLTNPATRPIVAMVQGSCPTAVVPTVHNFVRLPTLQDQQSGWAITSDGSGQHVMSAGAPWAFALTNITFEPVVKPIQHQSDYTCANGIFSNGQGPDAVHVHAADSGVLIRTEGVVAGGFLGLPQPPSSYADLPVMLGHGKHFLGIEWNGKLGVVTPVRGKYMSPGSEASYDEDKNAVPCVGSSRGCIFAQSVDPETGEAYEKPYVKTFVAEMSDPSTVPATPFYGLFEITGTKGNGAMAMKDIAGKYVLVEAAKLASDGAYGDPYNAILVEQ